MPLGDRNREYSLVSVLVLLSVLSSHYLWHLAGPGDSVRLVRSTVRSVRSVILEISDWVEWLDDLATSLEVDTGGEEREEEEEGTRMVIGLQDSSGRIVNATEELEYFASSTKPRRKHPAEILFRVGEIVFHREYEVRGVVLGWDKEAKAPLSWLRQAGRGRDIPERNIFCSNYLLIFCFAVFQSVFS